MQSSNKSDIRSNLYFAPWEDRGRVTRNPTSEADIAALAHSLRGGCLKEHWRCVYSQVCPGLDHTSGILRCTAVAWRIKESMVFGPCSLNTVFGMKVVLENIYKDFQSKLSLSFWKKFEIEMHSNMNIGQSNMVTRSVAVWGIYLEVNWFDIQFNELDRLIKKTRPGPCVTSTWGCLLTVWDFEYVYLIVATVRKEIKQTPI